MTDQPHAAITIRTGPVTMPGGRVILQPLDLQLSERRIAVIGRNGSGKTSFMRLLAGLIRADHGAVTLQGADMYKDRRAALTQIGILFQNPDHQILMPTVTEELAFGLIQKGMARKEAEAEVARRLQVEGRSHWVDASTATLSGGQKQYLCLLAILMMQPQCLLLDEPFSGLDMPTALRLRRRLAQLPQQLITIGHDPRELGDCTRVLWFEAGRVQMDGPPETVLPVFTETMIRAGERDADTDLAS
ncbi:ABC transporter ATP-binding protein [Xinfangfangia sp. D13-10-4-6]|uniref:energy-coupling factor ABC transporter ATP-binding protein n=1 Tax=Pseudogemmobacter hezensis TaxID=2737662 RepID=UPI001555FDC5|nr:ABC transporter ATP-binding protein [Pseudogemmobacter hezensis]NPD13606.1 ABC transporter ATP-binding protein [Pseudogemmobacter hezensis]